MHNPKTTSASRVTVGLAFAALLLHGLATYRDYGISWDEPHQRYTGAVALKYLAELFAPGLVTGDATRLPPLATYVDRDHGTAFELPLVALEALLRLTDKRDVLMLRHLATFLFCFLGVIALYRMAARRFGDWRLGLLAAGLLVLSPRLFAESFYNSKDAVFMAAFAIGTATLLSFVLKPNARTALLCAVATAFAIDVRLMGVMLPAAATAILAARVVRRELPPGATLRAWSVYLAATALLTVAFWPWLWADPVGRFAEAFANMARFRWAGDTLFMGRDVVAGELPWHYAPVWIAITTPFLHLALFAVGAAAILWRFARRGTSLWRGEAELQDLVFLTLFALPILAVISLNSVIYGGWRHLYFVYPAFLMVAVRGWQALWELGVTMPLQHAMLLLVTAIGLVPVAVWMVRAHPLQNVYFNALAGFDVRHHYDLDYWGLGNRLALERIVKSDPSPLIVVGANSETPVVFSIDVMPPADRQRLKLAGDTDIPDYVLDNYHGLKVFGDARLAHGYDLFYQHKVDGELIFSIFKRKPGH
jgi:hypothetical protein